MANSLARSHVPIKFVDLLTLLTPNNTNIARRRRTGPLPLPPAPGSDRAESSYCHHRDRLEGIRVDGPNFPRERGSHPL